MTSFNLGFSLFFGIIFWLIVYFSLHSVLDNESRLNNPKYKSVITGTILPIALFGGFIVNMMYGFENSLFLFISHCINLILIITGYYLLVFVLLKVLRKHYHPLVVSTIWMLPNSLYFFVLYRHKMLIEDTYILELSPWIIYPILLIWSGIFLFIIGYKIYEHLSYRKSILKDAIDITDEHIIQLFENEISKIDYKIKKIKLMQSDHIQTPLTIGVRNKVVVLPNSCYTDDEYEMIFNHEIIHIARNDVFTKVYFVFCNAFCWFNPLMWIANKKCSEDLELSCDKSVLIHKDDFTRKQYARLILNNISSEKGFTSCLSTNAKSLQYRLRNIVQPKYKKTGGLLILIFILVLVLSWGNVVIAVKGYHGYEDIFDSKEVQLLDIYPINTEYQNRAYTFDNEDKIIEYISKLELSRLPNSIIRTEKSLKNYHLNFKMDEKDVTVQIYEYYIVVDNNEYYYVKDGINYDVLDQFITSYPSLKLDMLLNEEVLGYRLWPTLRQVSTNNKIVYSSDEENEYRANYVFYPTDFKMNFYDELLSDIEVIEETEDSIKTYIIDKDELNLVKIPQKDVHYTIKTTCKVNKKIYDVVYTFNLEK